MCDIVFYNNLKINLKRKDVKDVAIKVCHIS